MVKVQQLEIMILINLQVNILFSLLKANSFKLKSSLRIVVDIRDVNSYLILLKHQILIHENHQKVDIFKL